MSDINPLNILFYLFFNELKPFKLIFGMFYLSKSSINLHFINNFLEYFTYLHI